MARVLNGSHSFTCTPRVHPLMERTIPAFAFKACALIICRVVYVAVLVLFKCYSVNVCDCHV